MRIPLKLAACAALVATFGACGEERGPGGLTSEDEEKLNSIAEQMEAENVTDTSGDSLTLDEEWTGAEAGEPIANAPAANGQ